jgi:hypothetical protein
MGPNISWGNVRVTWRTFKVLGRRVVAGDSGE